MRSGDCGHAQVRLPYPAACAAFRSFAPAVSRCIPVKHAPQCCFLLLLLLQATILLDAGSNAAALQAAQECLSLRQQLLRSDHPDMAHALLVLAEVQLAVGQHQEADTNLSAAVQVLIAQLGSSHPATQRAHMLMRDAANRLPKDAVVRRMAPDGSDAKPGAGGSRQQGSRQTSAGGGGAGRSSPRLGRWSGAADGAQHRPQQEGRCRAPAARAKGLEQQQLRQQRPSWASRARPAAATAAALPTSRLRRRCW